MSMTLDPRAQWQTLSQAERDAAYDNNKAVADSPALIAERNEASAALRASRASALDVPYAPGERTKYDLYPAVDKAAPCLVFIHGGYWQRNSRDLFAMMVEGMAAHGWSVAIMGYTLAPEATMTQIAHETRQALDWLAADGPSFGIAGPIVLSGWSAGAQMTAMALDHPAVTAGLALSGVYDLGPIRDTGLNAALAINRRRDCDAVAVEIAGGAEAAGDRLRRGRVARIGARFRQFSCDARSRRCAR